MISLQAHMIAKGEKHFLGVQGDHSSEFIRELDTATMGCFPSRTGEVTWRAEDL